MAINSLGGISDARRRYGNKKPTYWADQEVCKKKSPNGPFHGLKRNVSDRNHKSPWQIGPFEGSSSSKQRRQYSLAEQELPLGGSPALPNHHHHANQTRDHLCRVVIRSPNTPTGSRHEKKQYCHVKLSQRKSWSKLERLSPSSSQDSTTGSASSSRDIQTCLRGRANHLGRGSSDEDDDDDEDDVCQRGSANYVTVLKIDDSPTGVSRQLKQSQYHRNCIPDPPWIKPERPSRPCGNRVKSVIKSYEIEPKEEHPRKFSDSSIPEKSSTVEEDITIYRLPGQKLGLGLKFEGGSKSCEHVKRLYIQNCAQEGPCRRVRCTWGRLEIGDEILYIAGKLVRRMTRVECVKALKGEELSGTKARDGGILWRKEV